MGGGKARAEGGGPRGEDGYPTCILGGAKAKLSPRPGDDRDNRIPSRDGISYPPGGRA
jgi:hypothetical protein